MFNKIAITYQHSKMMYYGIMFGCFVVTVFLIPQLTTLVAKYIVNEWIQKILPYVIAYVLATLVLPEIVASIMVSFSGGEQRQ
jgi:branched-subunit amino acid transport protein